MINDIISLLRFITDPETRRTVQALASIPSRDKLDWKRDAKTATAQFSGTESFRVAGFANALIANMRTLEISDDEIRKFRKVFDELVRNAFDHGCREATKCKVSITCTYSRWFILLHVSDSGRGFDFARAFTSSDGDTHGLELVQKLAYRFTANKKGNSLTALLISAPVIQLLPHVEKHRGREVLILKVSDTRDWNYLITDWEPLRHVVRLATQNLILIDCVEMIDLGTKPARIVKKIVKEFKEFQNRFFALVIDREIDDEFDFSRLNSDKFQVFVVSGTYAHNFRPGEGLVAARNWLLKQPASGSKQ